MQQNIRSNFDKDPNTCLLKLRQFAELLAQSLAAGERASYGGHLLDLLGRQLSHELGRGFEASNLRRMVKFAQAFSDAEIVSTLSTKLRSAMRDIRCPFSG